MYSDYLDSSRPYLHLSFKTCAISRSGCNNLLVLVVQYTIKPSLDNDYPPSLDRLLHRHEEMSLISPAAVPELEPRSRSLIGHGNSAPSVPFAFVTLKGVVCLVQCESKLHSDLILPY